MKNHLDSNGSETGDAEPSSHQDQITDRLDGLRQLWRNRVEKADRLGSFAGTGPPHDDLKSTVSHGEASSQPSDLPESPEPEDVEGDPDEDRRGIGGTDGRSVSGAEAGDRAPDEGENESLEARMKTLEQRLASLDEELKAVRRFSALSSDDFSYFWFEDQHRGAPEHVRESLRPYLAHYQRCQNVVDLGCGRGEFLDLCREEGIGAYGVDSNEDMVLHCRRLGHETAHGDILDHLRQRADKSLDGIFCSQVIEHLPLHLLVSLLKEGYRTLIRGTRMVLVTINTRSIFALTNNFYLDPTHVRPLPPETVRFLVEDVGFRKIEISYYSPFDDDYSLIPVPRGAGKYQSVVSENFARLNRVIFGYQEYAVIGLK